MKLLSAFKTSPRLGLILSTAALPLALFGYLVLGLTPMASWWLFVGTNLLWMAQEIFKDVSAKRAA
jgi:4-hydroxybenzoate polyprenyltransferase